FNQEVQQSISNYITQVRVNKAEELLQFSQMSIQNIASYVGFHDLNYFSKCFKKYKHITPTECRQLSAVKE
ncbi:MAG: AraC family transcriptional regulator, partial [Candidatus Niameybacter stercoravium]|nr:AraC family transcriptional regulator [Candidatus Niameybacter stercoravium]